MARANGNGLVNVGHNPDFSSWVWGSQTDAAFSDLRNTIAADAARFALEELTKEASLELVVNEAGDSSVALFAFDFKFQVESSLLLIFDRWLASMLEDGCETIPEDGDYNDECAKVMLRDLETAVGRLRAAMGKAAAKATRRLKPKPPRRKRAG